MKYYSMIGANKKSFAAIHAHKNINEIEIWNLLSSLKDANQWSELTFEADPDKHLNDIPPCDILGRVYSSKLKCILTDFCTNALWLPIIVKQNSVVTRYWLMHFLKYEDYLGKSSIIINNLIAKPTISLSKSKGVHCFAFYPTSASLIIDQHVKSAIENHGIDVELEKMKTEE